MAESIGIMDPAFFVGKKAILDWINTTFDVNYSKIEQTASGAIHCQILDAIFPGRVPLHKVNFNAKYDYEFVKNYKILQNVFNKEDISKHVDVEKLIKAKYQDNLEFCQWIKNFYDSRYSGQPYNASERRANCAKKYAAGRKHAKASISAGGARASVKKAAPSTSSGSSVAAKRVPATKRSVKGTASRASASKVVDRSKEVKELNEKLSKLRVTIEGLEKERNFYFGKLREIEVLCQSEDVEGDGLKDKVLEILYQTDDDDEFQAPEDAGEEQEEEDLVQV